MGKKLNDIYIEETWGKKHSIKDALSKYDADAERILIEVYGSVEQVEETIKTRYTAETEKEIVFKFFTLRVLLPPDALEVLHGGQTEDNF